MAVQVNTYKEILVGLAGQEIYDIKPNSIRKIVVLNQKRKIIHTYQYDRDNQRTFTWPRRIAISNDNVYVVDVLNLYWKGRVVALDYGGQIKWMYTGDDKQQSFSDKFHPRDITVTTKGRMDSDY